MEKIFLTQEEIDGIKDINNRFQKLKEELGEIEIQTMGLNISKEKCKDELILIQEKEKSLAQELQSKYGEGSISLETGEFIQNK